MKLGELAKRLNAELRGDAELEVTGVKGIEEAGPTEVTFVANPKYGGLARKTKAAAVLVEPEFPEIEAATIRVKNPYLAFSRTLGFFYQPPEYAPGIHPTAVVDPTAEIGEGAHIGAYVVVGPRVKLGAHATLLPHVVLYPGVVAGRLRERFGPDTVPIFLPGAFGDINWSLPDSSPTRLAHRVIGDDLATVILERLSLWNGGYLPDLTRSNLSSWPASPRGALLRPFLSLS